jgi:glycine/D-amino acid oxidase-like deaminating enzyme
MCICRELTSLRWPYKFVHALLRILLQTGNLDLYANTPVIEVTERDAEGWIYVKTTRGSLRARTVVHTTNRWASHLLPEFDKLIIPDRGSMNAILAPPGFIKHTGAQHWDSTVNVCLRVFAVIDIPTLTLTTELSSATARTPQHHNVRRRTADHHTHTRACHAERRREQTIRRSVRLL